MPAQKLAIEIEGNFQADARPASDHLAGEFIIGVNVLVDAESIGIAKAVEQGAAFLAAGAAAFHDAALVVDRRLHLADVGINGVAQDDHFQDGHDERKQNGEGIAPHVQHFFVEDGAKATQRIFHLQQIKHGRPPVAAAAA